MSAHQEGGEVTVDPRPHLVALVGNSIEHDNRVRKTAAAAAEMGLRVTIVAFTAQGQLFTSWMDDVEIVNVPVDFTLRDHAIEHRRFMRRLMFPLGYANPLAGKAAARRRRVAEMSVVIDEGRAVERGDYATTTVRGFLARVHRNVRKAWNRGRRTIVRARSRVWRFYNSRRFPHDRARAMWWFGHRPMGNWRRLVPEYFDYDVSFGPVIDGLEPDLIHAHDVNMIGVASNAVDRAHGRGRTVSWLYDAHEYVPGIYRYSGDRLAGMADHEREFIKRADAVLTVSDAVADAVQSRTGLAVRPTVILNASSRERSKLANPPSVRAAAGVPDDLPLLVYSGNIHAGRGVTELVEAIPLFDPSVHVAIVTNLTNDNLYVQSLVEIAAMTGCADRLHFVPYVPGEEIVDYLSTATVGVSGLKHMPNHEMALPNKLFEYMHAGLPMLVSDVKSLAEFVTELGIGEVYPSGDVAALAEGVALLLRDRDRYVRALRSDQDLLTTYSWERQVELLREVYQGLIGRPLGRPEAISAPDRGHA